MASIRPRTLADGTTVYAVIWREGGSRTGKQTSQTFDTEAEATTWKRFLDANGQSLTLAAEASEQATRTELTIREAAQRWVENATGIEDHTRAEYERNIRLHINPTLGNRVAADIEKDDIRAWVQHLQAKGSAASTIRLYHATLFGIMSWVIEQKIRPDNPCKGIRLPRVDKTKTRQKKLEHDDYKTIVLPEVPDEYKPLVEVIAGTGCRVSEATALLVADFRPGDRKKGRHGRLSFTKTWKRSKGRWTVGILKANDDFRTALDISWELNDILVKLAKGRHGDDPLLVNADGEAINYFAFEYVWTEATKRMMDPNREDGHMRRKPTIHWLRHSHGAWLLEKGVDIVTVSRRLGHASIKTTGDIYGHSTDAALKAAANALDSLGS